MRCLFPRNDFFRGIFLYSEQSYDSVQPPCYDQVLTEILPYGDSDRYGIIVDIERGKRPSRPRNSSQNRWLQDPVWDTITTCWSDEPEERHELSVVYQIFSEYGQRDTWNVKLGDLYTYHSRHQTKAETSHIETGQQQRGRFLPRIASLFQFLREPEPEIERSVSEMDKAGLSNPPLPSQD